MNNTFEILICTYGDYPELIQRCVNSILENSSLNNKIHIGLNDVGARTKQYLRNLLDENKICTLVESNTNLNKDPVMRILTDLVDSPYLIWFDDDSYVDEKDWDVQLVKQISETQADVLGFPHVIGYNKEYLEFLKTRSWYSNKIREGDPTTCHFPVGGVWVAKCEYLRKHNYPDRNMIHTHYSRWTGDMIVGDLLYQTGGSSATLIGWDSIFKVNKADRRGNGEDGWKNFNENQK
jgi:hypothetical protein